MNRLSSHTLGRTGLLLGMLVALALALAAMANAMDAVDHADGERHTHSGLTTAAVHDDGDSADPEAGDPADAGPDKSVAHHHHLDTGAGIAAAMLVVLPIVRGRDHRQRRTDARLADARIAGLQRPPRAGFIAA